MTKAIGRRHATRQKHGTRFAITCGVNFDIGDSLRVPTASDELTRRPQQPMLMHHTKRNHIDLAATTLMIGVVFTFDLLTPRGVASGMLYVVPVLATLWLRQRWSTPLIAAACILLTAGGYLFSSNGTPLALAILNRAIAILTIVAVGAVCMARRSAREALENANHELEEQASVLEQANLQLERSNADLEHEVGLRERAEVNLLRSNRELEEFAYVAAHDLTAPLRHVVTFLDLLQRDYGQTLDEQAKDYVAMASHSAKHVQALIGDLLTLARLDSERQPLAAVDCNAVVDRAVALLEPAIKEAGATVTHEPLPIVMGVEGQLLQVVQNLISNALKYRTEQPPSIHMSAIQRNGQWQLCVQDNGIGIDPHHADDVFKIFRRLHSDDEYPGTGIGLALCQRIVERHGGRIWLENSQPGAGSKFCFSLPNTTTPNNHVAA